LEHEVAAVDELFFGEPTEEGGCAGAGLIYFVGAIADYGFFEADAEGDAFVYAVVEA